MARLDLSNLSPQEIEALQLASKAALAREHLLDFAQLIDPSYERPPHIEVLGQHLEAVENGDIRRLIVTMPPRHGKSHTASGLFPSWCLGRDPTRRFILLSYAEMLANSYSVQNRDTISVNERWPLVFPSVTISSSVRAAEKWALHNQRDSFIASGIGGAITGFGAWCLIIDDPFKNEEEAASASYRDKIYRRYTTSARTRLTPDGRVIIIMTRWNEEDLVGKILSSDEGREFVVLHLPAESYGIEEDYIGREDEVRFIPKTAYPDALGRPKGEPLWANRYDKTFLQGIKTSLQYDYVALYQGAPTTPEGTKFRRANFQPITPLMLDMMNVKPLKRARSWDLAWSSSTSADWTVGIRATLYSEVHPKDPKFNAEKKPPAAFNLPPVFVVVEDVVRWQLEWDNYAEKMLEVTKGDGPGFEVLIEATASQSTAFKSLRSDVRLIDTRLIPIRPDSDKEIRAKPSMRFSALNGITVYQPRLGDPYVWEEPFLKELGDFPRGVNDDQVDAMTQLINHWMPIITSLQAERVSSWITTFNKKQAADDKLRQNLPREFVEAGTRLGPRKWRGWLA